MDLFFHNQNAYNEAQRRLETSNRTCIIHPTGTGKSLIIAEFINRNPNSKHLLLAPGRHIKDEISKHAASSFEFCTYAGLANKYDQYQDVNFIYLDEFHRIGADVWGSSAIKVIEANPNAKVVGTSATPIRYLDDQRNMADEVFEGNIASEISLFKAIESNILRAPKYVSALYSIKEESELAIKKIEDSNHPDKAGLIDKIKSTAIDWENSGGIDAILKKHLLPGRKRILVFCKDRKHMEVAMRLLMPSFRNIWMNIQHFEVYSEFGNKRNEEILRQFSDDSLDTKVLFTIDKLNEGLHVKGANTVVMLRDTTSPIIYYQQIGRCFSVGQSQQPLIFDLVNNFSSVRANEFQSDYFKELGNGCRGELNMPTAGVEKIEFIDETKHWNEVFRQTIQSTESWESGYAQAREFFQQNGHLRLPDGSPLVGWARWNRALYANNKLSPERFDLLLKLSFKFNPRAEIFADRISELSLFVNQYNELPTIHTNKSLHNWINDMKKLFNKGRLSNERVLALKQYLEFDNKRDVQLDESFKKAQTFFKENGHLNVPKANKSLYLWIGTQKSAFDKLSKKRQLALLSIGFVRFSHLHRFLGITTRLKSYQDNNNGNYPKSNDDKPLYNWVLHQRKRFIAGKIKPEEMEILKSIGFRFCPF